MDRTGKILGGSDWGDVLSLKPYGCARKLWYQKTGQKPDYPQEVSGPMQRGTRMEKIVADIYAASKQRKLQKRKSYPAHGPEWLQGSPDYRIMGNDDGRGPGILEVKTAGEWAFKKFKREGLPGYYVMQLQHYLALTGYIWGAWAILWPDAWEFVTFDVERDDKLIGVLWTAGELFIRALENGPIPDRIDPPDRRCSSCPFRTTCQGQVLLEAAGGDREDLVALDDEQELPGLLADYRELKSVVDEATDHLDVVKAAIKGRMKAIGHEAAQIPGSRVYCRTITSMRIDSRQLRKDQPQIAEKYSKPSISTPLKVYFV